TLLDGAMEDAQHRGAFMEQIADQADRLHLLILDLLSLARIESSSEVYEYQPVALGPLVSRCIERHRARAESNGQVLEAVLPVITNENRTQVEKMTAEAGGVGLSTLTTPIEQTAAWADEEAVSQILDNLVDNALKYTPPGGRVSVRWHSDDGHVCLEVEDTGIG